MPSARWRRAVYAGTTMAQTTKPRRRSEVRPALAEERDELRDEIDALLAIARGGVLQRSRPADRRAQLRAMLDHWAPALRELEKH